MTHWVQVILEDTIWGQKKLPAHVRNGLKRIEEMAISSEVLQFRTHEFEEIADELSICDDLSELSLLLWKAATSAGFQHFSLFVVHQGRSPSSAHRMCTSYKKDWLDVYQEKSYQYVDPIVAKAKSTDGKFLFSEASSSAPMVQAFWDDAEKHNIGRNGLCYVVTRSDGTRIAISFSICGTEKKSLEIIRLNTYDLEIIAQLAIECFCYNSTSSSLNDQLLSTSELRFLHILATSANPESALSQMPAFGGNEAMQSSIRKKLGVNTIFQAISIACSKQWFDNLPFYPDEIVSCSKALSGWQIAGLDERTTPVGLNIT